ncbi:MAG: DUF3108 domain-containing protein [Proteobacteria bacterium]|nr:DUF3108 domain-containing protein [Pseudomonadota bacterium]
MKFAPLFLLLGLFISTWAMATDLPSRIKIKYAVKTDIGEGEIDEVIVIKHIEGKAHYSINSEAQATGMFKLIEPNSIIRHSEGFITPKGLRPVRAYEKRGQKKPSVAEFDWKNHVITLHHKEHQAKEIMPDGTLDRLSMSYNFMFTALPKHHVERHIINGDTLQLSRYTITKETLDTPIGKMETVVLTRQEEKHSKLKRKLWLALNNHMLPVRIVSVEDNGREIEKMVTEVNISYKTEH